MDATSFEFTMTMPGDERLVGAVRDLTLHAAKYAQLSDRDVQTLVDDVLSAAASAAAGGADTEVEVRFERTPNRLDVAIAWEGPALAPPGATRSTGTTSTQWTHDGRRQCCVVSHRARRSEAEPR